MDGTVVTSGNTNNKVINFTNLTDGTYYKIAVGTDCSGPQAFAFEQLFMEVHDVLYPILDLRLCRCGG